MPRVIPQLGEPVCARSGYGATKMPLVTGLEPGRGELKTEGGIRTHGAREDTLVFKTRAINHSTTSPDVNPLDRLN